MKMCGLYGFLVISLTLFYRLGICEVYTSTAEMKDIILLETGLIEVLEKYIQLENEKLDKLNRYLDNYKEENSKAMIDGEAYLGNPINAYLLVKRLVMDWEQIELLMSLNNTEILQADISSYKENPKFPTVEDLNGTISALIRLQNTYNLDTVSIARGELNGIKYSSELSALDCFEIGKRCFENNDFYFAHSWLTEADAKITNNTGIYDTDEERSLILEYMALSAYELGNVSLALNLTNKLLHILPSHPEAVKRKILYENEIQQSNGTKIVDTEEKSHQLKLYQSLCSGTITPPIETLSKLYCRYMNNNNYFLLIAPFKSEELFLEPRLVLFHDVLSDKEIEVLKELSYSRFETARVGNDTAGKNTISLHRIGKVAWLQQRENEHVKIINRRVSHMTGLSVKTSEPLQVCNYGVGGHFLTHYDFSENVNGSVVGQRGFGNRIATVLFYMSDVSQGGGTVFPVPKLNVKPKKGSAVFWFNLHPNGEGDKSTVHGSCPVLAGSKWVSNKWLYEHGQEFLRPCEVNRFPPDVQSRSSK